MGLLSTKTGLPSFSDVDQSIINIVDNPSARRDTTGWTAATNYSVTRDISNSPLAGVIDSCFAISTTTASTESSTSGVYAASLAMPAALRNSKVQGNLWVTVPATSAGVWRLSVYNASGTRMTLDRDSAGVFTLPGGYTGQLPFTFDADSSATYTVSFTQTTRTSSNTLYVTNISIGNGQVSQTSPQGVYEKVSSFTIGGTTTAPTAGTGAAYFREVVRDGSDAVVRFEFSQNNAGSAGSGDYLLPLPSGLSIDYTRAGVLSTSTAGGDVGYGTLQVGATLYEASGGISNSGSYVNRIFVHIGSETQAFGNAWSSSLGALSNATVRLSLTVRIPIAEWAGSVNTGPVPAEEFASNNGSGGTAANTNYTTGTVYGPAGSAFPGATISSATALTATGYDIVWQYPVQSDDEVVIEISPGGSGWVALGQNSSSITNARHGSVLCGMWQQQLNSTTTRVYFSNAGREQSGSYGIMSGNWAGDLAGWRWRVRKTKKAALPFANAGTDGSAGLYKAGQAPGLKTGVAIGSDYVGEVRKSLITALTSGTTSATYFDATSISLPAGIWSVTASVNFERNGVTFSSTNFVIGLSTTSGNSSAGFAGPSNTASSAATIPTSFTRHALWINNTIIRSDGTTLTLEANNTAYATGTTLYLKTYMDTYASGTPQYTCYLQAVRIA